MQQAREGLDPEPERIARARDAVRVAWLDAHPPRPARWPWFAAAALAGPSVDQFLDAVLR
jgi:hypothetical protein